MEPRYIAMWSGPRNISTAMMRSWENRADTYVHDEPLYAHYLHHTRIEHPGANEIIATYDTDWRAVVQQLTGPVPGDNAIYYQKHMTHHMLPHIDREWLQRVTNCFLIREPARVITSLSKVLPNPSIEQTGIPQQVALFQYVVYQTGEVPPVLDARDVLIDPERALRALCLAIDVPFDDAMLAWPPGPRDTDGVWAKHWYGSVEKSTGFMAYKPSAEEVPNHLVPILDECERLYGTMSAHRLLTNRST